MSGNDRKRKKLMKKEDIAGSVESYKESAKSECEVLALDVFPQRILEMESLLQSGRFNPKKWSPNYSEVNIEIPDPKSPQTSGGIEVSSDWPAFHFPNGLVETNCHLMELIAILKPKALQLMKDMNFMRVGISLMIPKIEDGNNFGVEVQREMLIGVAVVEVTVQQHLDVITDYFTKRAEIVTRIARYPHCIDFRKALEELDHGYYLILCFFALDLRNQYIKVQDMFIKNLKKIKEPRSSDNSYLLY